ncbi:Asp/Glu/hydantoin racemase [Ancylobacter novellus DSM 506]|uniref:Asp/Glu/hydantoin racemase n=1 Tax=Ancylobacter novellus (strain ATCC 8093 / DSM 506 / JCM 20403 / CCM 1077 / IAM 12100 / NBRC 12443 / NCIMB 10456) TaxID=639283 RepID=D6ZZ85_ANCN5|nr:aspartate/glutamate racemase family protein [Ancylobacter novellus]ADH89221.1 Asp/Glu/hydantoin racemase [Ancylobacter novellus DSM 506]
MAAAPRITLLHATPVAMEPIRNAFARRWPAAETVNLLDDGLSIDRARETELTEAMIERFVSFGRYAHSTGADGILITCSAFGPAIDRLIDELPIPVLKPNEAMFRAAISQGNNIGMLATFAPAVATMTEEFDDFVREGSATASLTTIVVDRAIDLLRQGDASTHNELVAARAPELQNSDAIMLAHFSTSRAAEAVRKVVDVPVLTAPDAAVDLMKQLIEA